MIDYTFRDEAARRKNRLSWHRLFSVFISVMSTFLRKAIAIPWILNLLLLELVQPKRLLGRLNNCNLICTPLKVHTASNKSNPQRVKRGSEQSNSETQSCLSAACLIFSDK